MSETPLSPELDQKKELIKSALELNGITFPENPIEYTDKQIEKPREWLLRGQSSSVFMDASLNYTLPWTTGELTRGGVFFADNFKPLMLTSAIIAARTDEVHDTQKPWLIRGSEEFELQVQKIASELKVRVDSIGGYHDAALKVQRMFDTYEPKTGITTLHTPFPLHKASHIFLLRDTFNDSHVQQMPQELQEKIHWI